MSWNGVVQPLVCAVCGKKVLTARELDNHVSKHTADSFNGRKLGSQPTNPGSTPVSAKSS